MHQTPNQEKAKNVGWAKEQRDVPTMFGPRTDVTLALLPTLPAESPIRIIILSRVVLVGK